MSVPSVNKEKSERIEKMDQLEKVEKIREKTGVTYEEAKAALEAANGDILDALVYLENQGKVKKPDISVYSTESEKESSAEFKEAARNYETSTEETFGEQVKKFLIWCGKMIKKGCENFFVVSKNEEVILTMPVLVLILLLLLIFWIVLPALIVGLFCGFRYHFRGSIAKSVNVNEACDKAAEAAENIKAEFTK